ncbi:MAG: DUF3168 domain-containing protein [Pseudomonadota bacterium]
MSASAFNLQKAIYAALIADAGLASLIGDPPRVFDDAPAGAIFPYVILGEAREKTLPGLDDAFEHELKLYVFSRYAGRRLVQENAGAGNARLARARPRQ